MENVLNSQETEQLSVKPENQPAQEQSVNINKTFNIVSLAYACVLLVAQIFLLLAMYLGIVAADGIVINSTDLTHFIKLMQFMDVEDNITKLTCVSIIAAYWLAVLVVVVIGLIKAIIGIFKFFKLNEEYLSREMRFSKYVKNVSGSYAMAIALIACSLAFTPSFTAMGTGVVVFGCILYVASSAIVILFKQVLNPEEKLDIVNLIISTGKKLVMFMLAFLLVANIKESFNISLNNIFDESLYGDNDVKQEMYGIYFKVAQPMSLIIPYLCVAIIVAYIVKFYPLNNSKKDVNLLLKQSFIALLVISLLFCVGDCVIFGMAGEAADGSYLSLIGEWLGLILVSVAGIILTLTKQVEKQQLRG